MRNFVISVAVLGVAVAGPLVVGAQEGGNQADGWETRLDGGTDETSVLHFRTMGDGVHASTAGRGGAIFWQPNSMAKADYTISATFAQTEPSGHPNAYGLFFGGSDLAGANQRYSYFVISARWRVPRQEAHGRRDAHGRRLDRARCDHRSWMTRGGRGTRSPSRSEAPRCAFW